VREEVQCLSDFGSVTVHFSPHPTRISSMLSARQFHESLQLMFMMARNLVVYWGVPTLAPWTMECEKGARDESSNGYNVSRKRKSITHRVAVALIKGEIHPQETAQPDKGSEEEHDEYTASWPLDSPMKGGPEGFTPPRASG
jgi:hypothetical protein